MQPGLLEGPDNIWFRGNSLPCANAFHDIGADLRWSMDSSNCQFAYIEVPHAQMTAGREKDRQDPNVMAHVAKLI
jgi:hypothetical protein